MRRKSHVQFLMRKATVILPTDITYIQLLKLQTIKMKDLNLFLYTCISIIVLSFISSCKEDDGYSGPCFEFDTEGFCYLPYSPTISLADFQIHVVGHAWKITSSTNINEKGELYKSDYEALGAQYTTYHFLNDTVVTDYYRIKKLGYRKGAYNYSPEKNLLITASKDIHRIVYVGEKELVTIFHPGGRNYKYNTYKKLTDEELQHYKESHCVNFDDVEY